MNIKLDLQLLIFLLTSVLIIGTSAAVSIYSYKKSNEMVSREFGVRADIIINNFAYQAFEGIIVQDPYMLDLLCKGVLEEKNVVSVFVYDHKQNILYQLHNGPDKDTDVSLPESGLNADNLTLPAGKIYTSNLLDVSKAVQDRQNKESIIGYVRIGVSLEDIIALRKELVQNFIIILAVVLGAGLTASYLLMRDLTTPLQRFVNTMSRIILTGNLDEKIENPSYLKEVDKIQRHFNDMLAMLSQKTSQLAESEEKFREISSSAQDAIIMMDDTGKVSFWNKAAEGIFGYAAEEIIGQGCHDILSPEQYHKKFFNSFSHFKKTGTGGIVDKVSELQARRKSGEVFPVELSLSSVKINGAWNGVGFIRDVSERKKIDKQLQNYRKNLEKLVEERTEELKEAQKELINKAVDSGRAQLSAMILHNIGNAITPISVNIETLKKSSLKNISHYLAECFNDLAAHKEDLTAYITKDPRGMKVAQYMESLIKDFMVQLDKSIETVNKSGVGIEYVAQILSSHRAYAPGQEEAKERVRLNLVIQDALKIQAGSISKRNIRVKKELASGLDNISIEKNKLMQVIVNFIKNSCDAIDENQDQEDHEIKIETLQKDNCIRLKISDTGCGVDPEKLHTIFNFGVSTKGSSGFGLYYCKSFVEANKGTLTINSCGRNQGAAVTLELRP